MYRPAFAVDSIGDLDPASIPLALACMGDLLLALTSIDRRYMRLYGERIPSLYSGKFRYRRLPPEPGTTCGDDDWADVITVLEKQRGEGDCEDLACIRAAELAERFRIEGALAYPDLRVAEERSAFGRIVAARHDYHVLVRWPETGVARYPSSVYRAVDRSGRSILLEDPSRVLGMR